MWLTAPEPPHHLLPRSRLLPYWPLIPVGQPQIKAMKRGAICQTWEMQVVNPRIYMRVCTVARRTTRLENTAKRRSVLDIEFCVEPYGDMAMGGSAGSWESDPCFARFALSVEDRVKYSPPGEGQGPQCRKQPSQDLGDQNLGDQDLGDQDLEGRLERALLQVTLPAISMGIDKRTCRLSPGDPVLSWPTQPTAILIQV